jgi:hypothetical protein
MMFKRLLIVVVLMSAVVLAAHAQSTPEREIYTVLHYGDDVFEPDVWLASAAEEASRTTATWRAESLGAVAFASYLHFDEGVTPDTVKKFFTNEWFNGSFTNYQGFREMTHCDVQDVTVHEFSMLVNNQKYMMRYWIKPVSDTRILTIFIVFPTKDQVQLDEYAQKLFPDVISCANHS